jgi:hypothetical protein
VIGDVGSGIDALTAQESERTRLVSETTGQRIARFECDLLPYLNRLSCVALRMTVTRPTPRAFTCTKEAAAANR